MGTTPNYNIPYPESTDFVAQGAAAMQAIADGFDTVVKNVEDMTGGPITTKGDLIAGDTSGDPERLPVGTDGQVLIADSAEALGMKWASAGAWELISSVTSSSTIVSFTVNVADYRELLLFFYGGRTTGWRPKITLNNDTTTTRYFYAINDDNSGNQGHPTYGTGAWTLTSNGNPGLKFGYVHLRGEWLAGGFNDVQGSWVVYSDNASGALGTDSRGSIGGGVYHRFGTTATTVQFVGDTSMITGKFELWGVPL